MKTTSTTTCTDPCGHLVLLEYGTSHTGLALQLAAELLRWPEEIAFKLYNNDDNDNDCISLPDIPVNNKYFSTDVCITILTDSERSNRRNTSTVLGEELLQKSTLTTGCVLIVDESISPEQILWDSIPERCLFRVLMVFHNDDHNTMRKTRRDGIWYDACVNNGFEYISHSSGYEVLPEGVETCGLLAGDLSGAARVLQILHNTLWPETCRVDKCNNNNNNNNDKKKKKENRNSSSNEREIPYKRGSRLENRVALIGIHTRNILDWFYVSLNDHRFFTMEWPPQKEQHENYQRMTSTTNINTSNNINTINTTNTNMNTMLAIANKYYTAMVGVEYMHPALFFPAMEDLFMAQY
ncbi:uncharacterized protein TM35_000151460, partial [Trypanosoma theileri]